MQLLTSGRKFQNAQACLYDKYVVDNDCGLSNLRELVEKNVTHIGAEDHLLGGS